MLDSSVCLRNPAFQSAVQVASRNYFPSEYLDYASMAMPKSWREMVALSLYLYTACPELGTAFRKLNAYFITPTIHFSSPNPDAQKFDDNEQRKWLKVIEGLKVRSSMLRLGDGLDFLGNSCWSLPEPFMRFVKCKHRCQEWELLSYARNPDNNFEYSNNEFRGVCNHKNCPSKGAKQLLDVEDRPRRDEKELRLKEWPITEIVIDHRLFTGTNDYYWQPPGDYKARIMKGVIEDIAEAPREVLKAVHENLLYKFNQGMLYHAFNPFPVEFRTNGYGIPKTFTLSRQIWSIQGHRRRNQALNQDYSIPLRIFSPGMDTGSGGGLSSGPLTAIPGDTFARSIEEMIMSHRDDPTRAYSFPFPIQYQVAGGEASQLVSAELMEMELQSLFDNIGLPIEMYRGSIQTQGGVIGLRLMESANPDIVDNLNGFLQWVCDRVATIMSYDKVHARLERVTLSDSIERQMAALQLMMAGRLSPQTGLSVLGFDAQQEDERNETAMLDQARSQKRIEEKLEAEKLTSAIKAGPTQDPAQSSAPGMGGGGMGGVMLPSQGYQPPTTLEDFGPEADAMAATLIPLGHAQVRQELSLLRQSNDLFHAAVTKSMERQRRDLGNQGREMLLQGGGAAPPM